MLVITICYIVRSVHFGECGGKQKRTANWLSFFYLLFARAACAALVGRPRRIVAGAEVGFGGRGIFDAIRNASISFFTNRILRPDRMKDGISQGETVMLVRIVAGALPNKTEANSIGRMVSSASE